MLLLHAEDVRKALPMRGTIEAMKSAYAALSSNAAVVPLRTRLPIEARNGAALIMPAYVPGEPGDSLAVKIATLFPDNPKRRLPFIHAAVLVMDAGTGRFLAMLEGGMLTAIRTGAGAGAATDTLARPDSRTAAIFGTGPQAETQLEALCTVRPIEEVRVFSPNPAHVRRFIHKMEPNFSVRFTAAQSPSEAISGVDLISAATTSTTPVFEDADLPGGVHINGVGSYAPEMIEIPPETLARARVTVDSRSACTAEAGEVIRAVERGLLAEIRIAEIGEVILGKKKGRSTAEQITYFKSVGVAVQDAVAAQLALTNARDLGLGTTVNW